MLTFYETLAKVMEDKCVSAAELSNRTGLYPSYFSKMKNGHFKDVPWEKALIIISALGMTPDEFAELQNAGVKD